MICDVVVNVSMRENCRDELLQGAARLSFDESYVQGPLRFV
jgi:hypothetical protein